MRRLLLFLVLITSSCSQQPPITPWPQPVPGPVNPPPQTQPAPQPIVAPKAKLGDRWITLGLYGLTNSTRSDVWKIAKALYSSGFNGAYIMVDDRWCQVPGDELYAWPLNNGKFDLTKDDPRFAAIWRETAKAFHYYHLILGIKFDTVYFAQSWNQFPDMRSKIHPYTNNTFGLNYGNCTKCLLDSITFAPTAWYWLKWPVIPVKDELQLKWTFSAGDKLYDPRLRMAKTVMKAIADEKGSDKTWIVFWSPANETYGDLTNTKSLGDRSEIFVWYSRLWESFGLKPNGKDFFAVINRDIRGGTFGTQAARRAQLYQSVTRDYGVRGGLGAKIEFHIDAAAPAAGQTCDDGNFATCYVAQIKSQCCKAGDHAVKDSDFFFSTDGMKKISAKQFQDDNRSVLKLGYNTDILYEEGGKQVLWGTPMKPVYEVQKNFDLFFKYHAEIVKEEWRW